MKEVKEFSSLPLATAPKKKEQEESITLLEPFSSVPVVVVFQLGF